MSSAQHAQSYIDVKYVTQVYASKLEKSSYLQYLRGKWRNGGRGGTKQN